YTDARMPNIVPSCWDIDAADIDGDGDMDLFVSSVHNPGTSPSSASGASVYLFTNNGTGTFTDETYPRLPSDGTNRDLRPQSMEPIDYDGDGDLDLVVGRAGCLASDPSLRLWQNLGVKTGYFVDVSNTATLNMSYGGCSTDFPGGATDLQVGDLDGDGRPDIFVTREDRNSARNVIFTNNGNGSFTNTTSSRMASPINGRRSVLYDVDKDGDLDIYLVNYGDDRLYVNTGGGIYSDVTPANLPRANESVGAVVTDPDNDGDLDLVVAKRSRAQPRILFNIGSGRYQDMTAQKVPWSNDPGRNIIKGDFNGDGREDLLYVVGGQSRIFLNEP
ncbi:MAG: FG-GAP repeat domain-containing protein, partial [Myxococcales bacterium]